MSSPSSYLLEDQSDRIRWITINRPDKLNAFAPGMLAQLDAALDRAQARGARIITVDGRRGLAFAALAACSIDAAVAERRLHITADTPAEIKFAGSSRASSTHGNLVAGGSG